MGDLRRRGDTQSTGEIVEDRRLIAELLQNWVVWRDARRLGALPRGLAPGRPHDGDVDTEYRRRIYCHQQGRLGPRASAFFTS